jgi:thiol-disulfide isomerase/thioredoxin
MAALAVRSFALLAAGLLATGVALAAEVDRPAPQVDVTLLNGKTVKAATLRGKVVVTMLWATWSPAARTELPDVDRLYAKHHREGLEVFALSIDEDVGDVRDFWRKYRYTVPVGMRSDRFFDHFGRASTTPMFYIVDRGGILRHLIAGPIGGEKLETLVRPLLEDKAGRGGNR